MLKIVIFNAGSTDCVLEKTTIIKGKLHNHTHHKMQVPARIAYATSGHFSMERSKHGAKVEVTYRCGEDKVITLISSIGGYKRKYTEGLDIEGVSKDAQNVYANYSVRKGVCGDSTRIFKSHHGRIKWILSH